MTAAGEQLCYSDAYARTAEARVAPSMSGDATTVVLDRTVFYPGGGGQPSDRGLLIRAADGRSWTVRGARKAGGEIVHELEPDGGDPPAVGDLVQVDLDWARRLALMRTHTALHALCGVVWRDYGAQVTGGNMEPGSGRMDFEFERMSGDLVDAIEATVNNELAAARDVRVAVLPRAEAFAIPDLIRTKINLLPEGIEEIRTIEIVGLDLQADGGTHVANTREVGRHPGHRVREQGPDQQADPDRARGRLAGPRRQSSGIARRSPTVCRCPGRRASRRPPTTRTRRTPGARQRQGVEVVQPPSLVEIAGEDREAPERDIRLLPERAIGDQHAVVVQLRSVGKMLRLQGVELVLRQPGASTGGAGAPSCRRRMRRGCSDHAAWPNDTGRSKG